MGQSGLSNAELGIPPEPETSTDLERETLALAERGARVTPPAGRSWDLLLMGHRRWRALGEPTKLGRWNVMPDIHAGADAVFVAGTWAFLPPRLDGAPAVEAPSSPAKPLPHGYWPGGAGDEVARLRARVAQLEATNAELRELLRNARECLANVLAGTKP